MNDDVSKSSEPAKPNESHELNKSSESNHVKELNEINQRSESDSSKEITAINQSSESGKYADSIEIEKGNDWFYIKSFKFTLLLVLIEMFFLFITMNATGAIGSGFLAFFSIIFGTALGVGLLAIIAFFASMFTRKEINKLTIINIMLFNGVFVLAIGVLLTFMFF